MDDGTKGAVFVGAGLIAIWLLIGLPFWLLP